MPTSLDATFDFAGIKFKQTTTCPTTTISGQTYYSTYLVADDAVFSIFLGKNPENGEKNYKLMIQLAPADGTVADPTRAIGGWVAYNVRYTNTLRPGTTMTLRKFLSETSAS